MKKITKRDVLFFILGVVTMFLVVSIYEWDATKKGFMDGWNSASVKENTTHQGK